MNYYEYIKSERWQIKRKEFYSSKMYKHLKGTGKWNCYCCCRNDVPLDLHHRTYKRLGNERINIDFVPVCRSCHNEIHALFDSKKEDRRKFNLWSVTKMIKNKKQRKMLLT